MADRVLLIGLDFGTTTSCAVVASAGVAAHPVSGRTEFRDLRREFESPLVFTPLVGERLDESRLAEYLAEWLGPFDRKIIFGGGALITGLAAGRENAAAFARHVRGYVNDAVIATADDPRLESWLAFMGNASELSCLHLERWFVNLDIGGGTTNVAAGRGGEVFASGSLFVGARHVEVVPGTYEIIRLSSQARALFEALNIAKREGDCLSEDEVARIVDWYLDLLRSAVEPPREDTSIDATAALHTQVRFRLPEDACKAAITLSGGVGRLVYAHLQVEPWPTTTAYGDLGIDLARGLVESPFWRDRIGAFRPAALGRATVFGLLRYNTQVSGNTLYLSDSNLLPLADLPILGTIATDTLPAEVERLLDLAGCASGGAALHVDLPAADLATVKRAAATIREALARCPADEPRPLVLLVKQNVGKALGGYVTNWTVPTMPLAVVDEIEPRDARFAHVGTIRQGLVAVSLYGMMPTGESS